MSEHPDDDHGEMTYDREPIALAPAAGRMGLIPRRPLMRVSGARVGDTARPAVAGVMAAAPRAARPGLRVNRTTLSSLGGRVAPVIDDVDVP